MQLSLPIERRGIFGCKPRRRIASARFRQVGCSTRGRPGYYGLLPRGTSSTMIASILISIDVGIVTVVVGSNRFPTASVSPLQDANCGMQQLGKMTGWNPERVEVSGIHCLVHHRTPERTNFRWTTGYQSRATTSGKSSPPLKYMSISRCCEKL
jgi:hypothetical protein